MDPVKDALFIMQIYYAPATSPGYNMTLHVMHAVPGMSAPSLGIDHGNGMQMAAMAVSADNLYVFCWTTQNHGSLPVSFQSVRSVHPSSSPIKVINSDRLANMLPSPPELYS